MKIIQYTRLSKVPTTNDESLDIQARALEAWATANGYAIDEDDEADGTVAP